MGVFFRAAALFALVLAHLAPAAASDCPPAPKPFTAELFARAASQAKDRGMLWSIARDGRVSFLYGTLHLGREEWMAPGPSLRRALRETEVLALELDPLDPQVQRELTEAASALRRNLPLRLKDRLKAAMDIQCLPSAQEPSELQVLALTMALGAREGLSPLYGSEILLSVMAQGMRRPVISLETVAMQIRALTIPDEAEVARYIEESLNDIEGEKVRPVILKTALIWEHGDAAQLENYTQWCECANTPAERKMLERLMDDRNPGLAEGIDDLHKKGRNVLAAVGAMHMVGPTGLPALLAKRGYVVQRLH